MEPNQRQLMLSIGYSKELPNSPYIIVLLKNKMKEENMTERLFGGSNQRRLFLFLRMLYFL